ncbi:MAG: ribosome maturation factor RimM [Rickettsiales bacterium]|nr:ribosome maturation factor RimM [Rickettsiales bacterium]
MANQTNNILIARITSPHGLKGEVRGQFFTDSFESFEKLAAGNIKSVRQSGHDTFIATIDGAADRTAAEAAVGTEIFAGREAFGATKPGVYYISDLIGMDVYRGKEFLGKIAAVHNFGAGDIIEIESGDMLAMVSAAVDLDKRTININENTI